MIGCVVLTQGQRPEMLRAAITSLIRAGALELVVVGNGWDPSKWVVEQHFAVNVRSLHLAENIGIPAGRNAGARVVGGDLIMFLDDDAALVSASALGQGRERFDDDALGALQLRPVDPAGLASPRSWTPRLRVGDPGRSSEITALWEGAVMVRRSALDAAGGWAGEMFYLHEGIDLAWKLWDHGYRVEYAGDILVTHPAGHGPANHQRWRWYDGRNRALLVRSNLPVVLGGVHLMVWLLRGSVKPGLREKLQGLRDGWKEPVVRRPIRWSTARRMLRAGRPPVV